MSLGYQNGLKRGDAIASVNGRKVGNLEEFIKIFFKSRSRISLLEIRRESRYFRIEFPGEP
jgi:S1-C subfamily serine protease